MPEQTSTLTLLNIGNLRISQFCHEFFQKELVALYHSLNHEVVFLDREKWENLKRIISSEVKKPEGSLEDKEVFAILDELKKRKLVISVAKNEEEEIQRLKESFLSKPSFEILYLLLSDVCNFRCRYCFIEGSIPEGYKFSVMSEQVAKAGIDLFKKCIKRNSIHYNSQEKMIIFYGGEPLLNPRTFEFSLKYISEQQEKEELPKTLKKLLITNGSLVSHNIAELIKKYEVIISVSLDGWEEINDFYRIDADGQGTFKETLKGIEILQNHEIPVNASVTITPHNIDKLEQVFEWLVDEIGIKALGFNLLVESPSFKLSDDKYLERAAKKIIKCFQIGRKKGVYEDRIGRRIKAFTQRYIHMKDCGAYGNQLVISPNGKVGVCQGFVGSKQYFSGDINDPYWDPFKDPIFLEWNKRSPVNFDNCLSCPAIGICGGSCAYNSQLKFETIWQMDKDFCILPKTILEWLIWDLYSQSTNKKERR
jgi:uncharacterized protein